MATYRALLSLKSSLDDPDSLLSALRLLNLSNNVFNRTFPPELSNLTNLRVLDLYNNNLTGVLPVSVATFHSHAAEVYTELEVEMKKKGEEVPHLRITLMKNNWMVGIRVVVASIIVVLNMIEMVMGCRKQPWWLNNRFR
ncbi:hypothetical protein ACLB2K_031444 [Fragaria x ananassa]